VIATQARLDAAALQAAAGGGLGGLDDGDLDTRLGRALGRLDLIEAEEAQAIEVEQRLAEEEQRLALDESRTDPDQLDLFDLEVQEAVAVMPEAAE
jgi:hypothetical protein